MHPIPKPDSVHTIFGNTVQVLTDSRVTLGAYAVLEYTCVPHFRGPAPHWHAHTQEAFYVLEGTLSFWFGEERIEALAGSFVAVSPGQVHRFANETDQPLRFLCLLTPGGFEDYFADLAALAAREPTWPPSDLGKLERLNAKYDLHPPKGP